MTERFDATFRVKPPSGPALLKYLRTLRHLKFSQVAFLLARKLLPVRSGRAMSDAPDLRNSVEWLPFVRPDAVDVDSSEIEFLNKRRNIDTRDMNWRCSEETKLWRYNLHYFDYLHWDAYSNEAKSELIDSWIGSNPVGTVDASFVPAPRSRASRQSRGAQGTPRGVAAMGGHTAPAHRCRAHRGRE